MTKEELEQWVKDLKAAEKLQDKFPTASIRNICQQIEAIIKSSKM